jgi:hypothetical protein
MPLVMIRDVMPNRHLNKRRENMNLDDVVLVTVSPTGVVVGFKTIIPPGFAFPTDTTFPSTARPTHRPFSSDEGHLFTSAKLSEPSASEFPGFRGVDGIILML